MLALAVPPALCCRRAPASLHVFAPFAPIAQGICQAARALPAVRNAGYRRTVPHVAPAAAGKARLRFSRAELPARPLETVAGSSLHRRVAERRARAFASSEPLSVFPVRRKNLKSRRGAPEPLRRQRRIRSSGRVPLTSVARLSAHALPPETRRLSFSSAEPFPLPVWLSAQALSGRLAPGCPERTQETCAVPSVRANVPGLISFSLRS